MLRIDCSADPAHLDVRVSGRLGGDTFGHLAAVLPAGEGPAGGIVFDLQGVTAVDREGLAFLATQVQRGVRLVNCPLFLTLWLDAEQRLRIHDGS
jgi:hypothetical protein